MDANKIRIIRIIRENPRFRRYPEYKESGVEWIGEIPRHWNLSMLKYAARLVYGDTLISENRENGVVPVYGSNGIIDTHSSANALSPAIVVGRKGSLGKVQYSDVPCFVIDTAYYIDRRTSHVNLRWLHYVLQSLKLERFRNSVLPGLNRESTEGQYVPLITVEEQTQIVNFLDRKTEQIDALIRLKERRIELLQAQRTALINQAVTKGLDPNVEMKPSGVEWIGEVPRHWNLYMLKYTARLVYGDTLISENRENGVVPVYGSNGIIDTHSSANTLSPAIIVGRKGSLGKIQYSDVPCFVIDTAYFIDGRTSHVNLRWLYYVLHALKLERFRNSVLPGLNREDTEGQYVPLITAEEQDQIADFLDRKTQQIDDLIATEHQKIELLKEYRQSLISEAVTGKIDVRNEV